MAHSETAEGSLQAQPPAVAGHPQEQLEVEGDGDADGEENIVYPTGLKLWLSMISLYLSMVFVGLDLTIVAVAVPSLTSQFNTVQDIGWYSSAYMVILSSFTFLYAQLSTIFSIKRLFLLSICIFQLGSLLCAVAPISAVFILGRAVAGLGSCGLNLGGFVIIAHSFPRHRRPLWTGLASAVNGAAMVLAPVIGGALIDAFSWRACFGINLPLGVLTFALTAYGFRDPAAAPYPDATFLEKLKKLDFLGTVFFIPGIVCLLLGLQWGGVKYGWSNPVIIVLFVLFAALVAAFGYIQYRKQEKATLPPRILKQRSILAGAWFSACCNGILAVTEYYLAIYFQGVKGFSATKSGALGLPLMLGLSITGLMASALTSIFGYYYRESIFYIYLSSPASLLTLAAFMLGTSVIAPIAAGLLTTLDLDESIVKVLCLLGLLGAGIGLGIQGPVLAVQTVLPLRDVSTGLAVTGFAGGLGSSFFISVSSTLFQNRLAAEVERYAPGTNATAAFDHGGLADVREHIGADRLRDVLLGYDKAVVQTLYLPVALAALTVVGSLAMERRSVKKKQS